MTTRNYSVEGFTKADMTGKLIIKVQLGDDIRCIAIHNEDITYDELILMMQRIYQGKLNNTDDIMLKYRDEDGDLITIFDNSDLLFAIQCSKILKLTIFVNGEPKQLESDEVKSMKQELREIRNRVNHLLDRLDKNDTRPLSSNHDVTSARSDNVEGRPASTNHYQAGGGQSTNQNTSLSGTQLSNTGSGKEFDPLAQQQPTTVQNKLMGGVDAGGQNYANRTGTPDSVNSLGSAALTDNSSARMQPNAGGQTQQGQYLVGQGQVSANHVTSSDQGYMTQQITAPTPPLQQQQLAQQSYAGQQQQQQRSAFSAPQAASVGYPQQPTAQPGYQPQQPVTTGYSQQQPVPTGYNQQQQPIPTGYNQPAPPQAGGYQPTAATQQQPASYPEAGSGYTSQGGNPQGYLASANSYPQVVPGGQQAQGVAAPPPPGGNPYARGPGGPGYGQYARPPQNMYPQQS